MAQRRHPDDIVESLREAPPGATRAAARAASRCASSSTGSGLAAPADLMRRRSDDGHSNVTFALSTDVVLRRPPRGPLPPSAHDVLREARLLRALRGRARARPEVLAVCEDERVIGAPFYVMEHDRRRGRSSTRSRRARHARAARAHRRGADRRARRAARASTGSRPGSRASASRAATWSARCGASSACGSTTARGSCRSSSRSARGSARTSRSPPPATIVHGDYRFGNTMFAPRAPARADRRSSTGRWRRSAIRSPTSAT